MTRPQPSRQVGKYLLTKTVGRGSIGKVRIAIADGVQYACKIVKRPVPRECEIDKLVEYDMFMSDETITVAETLTPAHLDERRLIREMAITLLMDHPYIVTVHKVFISNYYYYIIMDFVNGTHVLDFIISHGKLKEKFAQNLFTQLISAIGILLLIALDYCHKNSICHRDLKIENILINNRGYMQLIDFGLANLYNTESNLNTFCGSLYFAAPELLSARKYVGPEIDVWSLGVILYVLVCGCVPFDDANLPALHAKIIGGKVDYPNHLSSSVRNLLAKMLVVNPENRAKLEEIKQHSWLSKAEKILDYMPTRKPISEPFNMQVIHNMGGFNFGNSDVIVEKLKEACDSGQKLNPVTSVYYLVKEKMERGDFKYKETNPTRILVQKARTKQPNRPQSVVIES